MAKQTLEKAYDPKPVEERWSKFWIEETLFAPESSSSKKKFSIVLPPPNVTGSLHMGHALCFTLPDIVVRWRRMQGYNVLWLPGTDHASIAVHNVIEQSLDRKGLSREKIGREEFLKAAWNWKTKYGGVIINQLKKLGFSLDWTRERFTMDEGFSRAVNKVFVDLYREGLIYRDYYLVNRCPHCMTVLSDIEVEHKELDTKLYTIRYPLVGSDKMLTVATTRPETMLGDTGIAVHPGDERYTGYVNKKVRLPLVGRMIPVVADEMVSPEFGSGAVKVTPAHDPVDFELGKRHGLEQVIVIDGTGKMTPEAGDKYAGLDRFECREKILADLEAQGFLVKVEDYRHAVGHCYRCKTIIEPHLSWQWFVKIAPLAKEAIKAVEEEKIRFIPQNWAKTYFEWMYNIHDWCISRQLWWGHRIPAWYCKDCDEVLVDMEPPEKCGRCGSVKLEQDGDILDTWFSSALWPFCTLGWPEETGDLKTFYPTDLMSTGFDIIFFWVARMIMMGLKFMNDIPFKHVFINGLVRDFKKRKMSKSEGNIVDPLEMIDLYGTDALRFTLAALAIPGMDISISEERMAGYRAFVNKIWNASRFVIMNLEEEIPAASEQQMTLMDRWIRSRLFGIIQEVNRSLEEYRFHEAADLIYHFIWHEFCDWYIELVKPDLKEGNKTTLAVLVDTLDQILRLLHPFMPFVTEEIWQKLPGAGKSIAIASFPSGEGLKKEKKLEKKIQHLQSLIIETRTIRAENRIAPRTRIGLWVKTGVNDDWELILNHQKYITSLANLHELKLCEECPGDQKFLRGIAGPWEFGIPLEEGLVDLDQEQKRIKKEREKVNAEIHKTNNRLQNENFVRGAPEAVVRENREKLEELQKRKTKLDQNLEHILSLMD